VALNHQTWEQPPSFSSEFLSLFRGANPIRVAVLALYSLAAFSSSGRQEGVQEGSDAEWRDLDSEIDTLTLFAQIDFPESLAGIVSPESFSVGNLVAVGPLPYTVLGATPLESFSVGQGLSPETVAPDQINLSQPERPLHSAGNEIKIGQEQRTNPKAIHPENAIEAPEIAIVSDDGTIAQGQSIESANSQIPELPDPGQGWGKTNRHRNPFSSSHNRGVSPPERWPQSRAVAALPAPTEPSSTDRFERTSLTDIQDHWAQTAIQVLLERGIVKGFPAGHFGPDDLATPVQVATMLTQAFPETPETKDLKPSPFPPQTARAARQHWYGSEGVMQPVAAVQRNVNTETLGEFLKTAHSDDTISQWQVLASISDRLALQGMTVPVKMGFLDTKQLQPNRAVTRAEVATFIYQALIMTGQL